MESHRVAELLEGNMIFANKLRRSSLVLTVAPNAEPIHQLCCQFLFVMFQTKKTCSNHAHNRQRQAEGNPLLVKIYIGIVFAFATKIDGYPQQRHPTLILSKNHFPSSPITMIFPNCGHGIIFSTGKHSETSMENEKTFCHNRASP